MQSSDFWSVSANGSDNYSGGMFWIAGIVKSDCFTMLTVAPGPDIEPYHDRQIVVLAPEKGMDWLKYSKPADKILKPLPRGRLEHRLTQENGQPVPTQ